MAEKEREKKGKLRRIFGGVYVTVGKVLAKRII